MDDQPLDLSKRTASSNTEYQLFPTEKNQESVEEVDLNPTESVSTEKQFLKPVCMGEKLVEQGSIKPKLSSQTSKTHENPKYGDKVPKGCDFTNIRKSEKLATNSDTKGQKASDSTTKNKHKKSIFANPNCYENSLEECVSPIPSTSAGVSCSDNDQVIQGNFRKSKKKSPLVCGYCSKVFINKCHYELHVRTHTGEKPFECQYCDKSFNNKIKLKEHIRLHTGERHFKCQECGRTFTTKNILKNHNLVHSEERPFLCEICNKAFKSKSNLKSHKNSHTNKPKEKTEK